jgi:hypothetical protein
VAASEGSFERIVKLVERNIFALLQVELHEVVVKFDDLIEDLRVGRLDRGEVGRFIGGFEETVCHGLPTPSG